MTKVFQTTDNDFISFTKGASEILVQICTHLLAEDNRSIGFAEEVKPIVLETVNQYAKQGYRILSFAFNEYDKLPEDLDESRDQFESNLIYLGFVAIIDPPRENVKEAIKTCHDAGVDVVMITGDAKATAEAIGKQIGIFDNMHYRLLDGSQLGALSIDDDLEDSDDLFESENR